MKTRRQKLENYPTTSDLTEQTKTAFEYPGSDVEPIVISADEVDEEIENLISKIGKGKEWDEQTKAMTRCMGLINGGALKYDNFFRGLNRVAFSLSEAALDLRSALVKTSCILIAQIAQNVGQDIDYIGDFITSLASRVSHGTQIIAESCYFAIVTIAKWCPSRKTFLQIYDLTKAKGSTAKKLATECLKLAIYRWNIEILSRHTQQIEEALKRLISDASSDVRQTAREAVFALKAAIPKAAENIINSCDPRTKKAINEETLEPIGERIGSAEKKRRAPSVQGKTSPKRLANSSSVTNVMQGKKDEKDDNNAQTISSARSTSQIGRLSSARRAPSLQPKRTSNFGYRPQSSTNSARRHAEDDFEAGSATTYVSSRPKTTHNNDDNAATMTNSPSRLGKPNTYAAIRKERQRLTETQTATKRETLATSARRNKVENDESDDTSYDDEERMANRNSIHEHESQIPKRQSRSSLSSTARPQNYREEKPAPLSARKPNTARRQGRLDNSTPTTSREQFWDEGDVISQRKTEKSDEDEIINGRQTEKRKVDNSSDDDLKPLTLSKTQRETKTIRKTNGSSLSSKTKDTNSSEAFNANTTISSARRAKDIKEEQSPSQRLSSQRRTSSVRTTSSASRTKPSNSRTMTEAEHAPPKETKPAPTTSAMSSTIKSTKQSQPQYKSVRASNAPSAANNTSNNNSILEGEEPIFLETIQGDIDDKRVLELEPNMDFIGETVIKCCSSKNSSVQTQALTILRDLIPSFPPHFLPQLEHILDTLVEIISEGNPRSSAAAQMVLSVIPTSFDPNDVMNIALRQVPSVVLLSLLLALIQNGASLSSARTCHRLLNHAFKAHNLGDMKDRHTAGLIVSSVNENNHESVLRFIEGLRETQLKQFYEFASPYCPNLVMKVGVDIPSFSEKSSAQWLNKMQELLKTTTSDQWASMRDKFLSELNESLIKGKEVDDVIKVIQSVFSTRGCEGFQNVLIGLLTVAHSTTTKTVDATLRLVMKSLKPIDVFEAVKAQISHVDPSISKASIDFCTRNLPKIEASEAEAICPLLIPDLSKAFESPAPEIRKSVVMCIVEMYLLFGKESMDKKTSHLSKAQQKLIAIYYERRLKK